MVTPPTGFPADPAPPWGTVEQGPDGAWWVSVSADTTTTTGPYLDEVQATRALHTWADTDGLPVDDGTGPSHGWW